MKDAGTHSTASGSGRVWRREVTRSLPLAALIEPILMGEVGS